MRVLIGVDGSTGSFEAARQMGELLAPDRDQVVLYFSPPEIEVREGTPAPEILRRAQESLIAAVFDEAEKALPEALRGRVERIRGLGNPREEILRLADEQAIEVIAVGARGLGQLETLLLGSLSRALVHSAKVPVLVARPRLGESSKGLRVLVACEGNAGDAVLARAICKLHWPVDAEGFVSTVVESFLAGQHCQSLCQTVRSPEVEAMAQAWRTEYEAEKARHAELLTGWANELPAAFHRAPLIFEGHPATQLVGAVTERQINLIVMGSRAHLSLVEYFLGGTTATVLSHSPCSVLVVPR